MDPQVEEVERKFTAIAKLHDEAHEKVTSDPLSAALRGRQVIEHIADYLHTRELGAAARNEMLDPKLKRLDMKGVIPRHIGMQFGTVQIHTNTLIHPDSVPRDPTPDELAPCMKSLDLVVDWFFRLYLKRPPPQGSPAAHPPQHSTPRPAEVFNVTPMNLGTDAAVGTAVGTGIGEVVLVWRGQGSPSVLQFDAVEGVLAERAQIRLREAGQEAFVGRQEKRADGKANDLVLPHSSVSADQASLVVRDTEVVLTNTSSRANVFVRAEPLQAGRSRALRHGDLVQFGKLVGSFLDGRYYASAIPLFVDVRTGLLCREGLVAEIARDLVTRGRRTLFALQCIPDGARAGDGGSAADAEAAACEVAQRLHRLDPAAPAGRAGSTVVLLLDGAGTAAARAAAASAAGAGRFVSGYRILEGASDQAIAMLEGAIGALSRLALGGHEDTAPVDLSRSALALTPVRGFADRARPLFDLGGGVVLFALGDADRLKQLAPVAIPILEQQLLEMLGARVGPRDVVSIAGEGRILFGTPGDADRLAHEVGVAWHARGPVTVNAMEFDRAISAHLFTRADLVDVASRVEALARGGISALGLEGFPAPLALAGQALDGASRPADRARHLLGVVETSWKLLALTLVAAARAARAPAAPPSGAPVSPWPSPWRALAAEAASRLTDPHPRVQELAQIPTADARSPALKAAFDLVSTARDELARGGTAGTDIEALLPRLERAVREIVTAFAPLRGWTLVSVDSSAVVDLDGVTQRIEYVDYTGPSARGSVVHVTVTGFRGLGRYFVYLVRWNENLAIAMEPFVRRARSPSSGDEELFVVEAPVQAPGAHAYRGAAGVGEIVLDVLPKQLGL